MSHPGPEILQMHDRESSLTGELCDYESPDKDLSRRNNASRKPSELYKTATQKGSLTPVNSEHC